MFYFIKTKKKHNMIAINMHLLLLITCFMVIVQLYIAAIVQVLVVLRHNWMKYPLVYSLKDAK